MMFTHARARRACSLMVCSLAFAVLAGCATTATVTGGGADPAAQFSGGRGGVAFRLTVMGVGISPFFAFWNEAELTQVEGANKGEKFRIGMSERGAAGSVTYFGALPPGRYQITSFSSQQCGALCINSSLTLGPGAIDFSVDGGSITYLGNLIYERTSENAARLLPPEAAANEGFRSWLRAYFPALSATNITAWTPGGDVQARAAAAARAAHARAGGFLSPARLGNGDVLYASLGGNLRRYSPSSGLASVRTGIASRVHAVLPLTERQWLVAGDFAETRITQDSGASWSDLKLELPYGVIIGMHRLPSGEVLLLLDQGRQLALYTGSVDANRWALRSSRDYQFDRWKGGITRPQVHLVEAMNKMMVAVPGGRSFIVDLKTLSLSEFEFPGGPMNVSFSGDLVLRCRCNKSGLWVATWESRDEGKTWQESTLDRTLPLPTYRDSSLALGLSRLEVRKSSDGGRQWKTVHTLAKPYWPFLLLPYSLNYVFLDNDRVVATDTLYKVLESPDAGETWKEVPLASR